MSHRNTKRGKKVAWKLDDTTWERIETVFHEVHVNTMEGFWSLLWSWLRPHRGISQERLPIHVGFSVYSQCPLAWKFTTPKLSRSTRLRQPENGVEPFSFLASSLPRNGKPSAARRFPPPKDRPIKKSHRKFICAKEASEPGGIVGTNNRRKLMPLKLMEMKKPRRNSSSKSFQTGLSMKQNWGIVKAILACIHKTLLYSKILKVHES